MEGVKNRVKGCLSCVVLGKRGAIGMKFRILCVSGLRKMGLLRQRLGFLCSSAGKESACNAGDPGSITGSERSPGEGIGHPLQCSWASLVAHMLRESTCSVRDLGSIPGLRRSPGEGNSYPLQYAGPENPMDRGAWKATVHGITELDTTE